MRDSAAGRKAGMSPLADFGTPKREDRPLDSPWSGDSWDMVQGLILDKVRPLFPVNGHVGFGIKYASGSR
jgi:hypothetical protein